MMSLVQAKTGEAGAPSAAAVEFYNLQKLVQNRLAQSASLLSVGYIPASWRNRSSPVASVSKTAPWAAETLEQIFVAGLHRFDPKLVEPVARLASLAELYNRRLTPNHMLLDELLAKALYDGVGGHLDYDEFIAYELALISVANESIYEDQALSKAVERFDRLISFSEHEAGPAKCGELESRATLTELELRLVLAE
jgi:hypothetical protein